MNMGFQFWMKYTKVFLFSLSLSLNFITIFNFFNHPKRNSHKLIVFIKGLIFLRKQWKYFSKFLNSQLDPKKHFYLDLSHSLNRHLNDCPFASISHENCHRTPSAASFSLRKRHKLISNRSIIYIFFRFFFFFRIFNLAIKMVVSFLGQKRRSCWDYLQYIALK